METTARRSSPESVRSRAPTRGTERQPFPSPHPEQQQPSPSRATTTLPIPSNNNLPHPGHQQSPPPPIRAERALVTPSVPHPNRGASRETRACVENAGESSPATPGARGQARLRLTLRLARHRATRAQVRPFGLVVLAAHPGSTYIWSTDLSATLVFGGGFSLLLYKCMWWRRLDK